METVKDPNFPRTSNTKFEKSISHVLAVGHVQVITKFLEKFDSADSFGYFFVSKRCKKCFNTLSKIICMKFSITKKQTEK